MCVCERPIREGPPWGGRARHTPPHRGASILSTPTFVSPVAALRPGPEGAPSGPEGAPSGPRRGAPSGPKRAPSGPLVAQPSGANRDVQRGCPNGGGPHREPRSANPGPGGTRGAWFLGPPGPTSAGSLFGPPSVWTPHCTSQAKEVGLRVSVVSEPRSSVPQAALLCISASLLCASGSRLAKWPSHDPPVHPG